MQGSEQETLWVLRAQSGDRAALNHLLRSVQEPLYRYLLGLVAEHSLAEDILQEVFLRIYRKLSWLREPELFRPWAYRIASREAFHRLRRERRWVDQDRDPRVIEAAPALPSENEATFRLVERLPELVNHTSPASRAVLAMHYLEGLTLEEVAEVLGLALGTVKSRLAYGLAVLRRLAKEHDLSGDLDHF